jgi:predicted enzyme related to lactoylglutathione lyase
VVGSWLPLVVLPLLVLSTAAAEPAPTPAGDAGIEVSGLEVRVLDVEQAAGFFGLFGFEAAGPDGRGEDALTLRNGPAVIELRRAAKRAATDDPAMVETHINLRVPDLAAAVADLKKRGYTFVQETPQEAPVGIFSIVKDASGNIYHLLEPRPRPASGVTPGIFNVGIRITDLERARTFYGNVLQFEIHSEDFLPALPLKRKGSLPLVLHLTATSAAPVDREAARTVVVLRTPDLAAAVARLESRGTTMLDKTADRALFADPFGNVLELREMK